MARHFGDRLTQGAFGALVVLTGGIFSAPFIAILAYYLT